MPQIFGRNTSCSFDDELLELVVEVFGLFIVEFMRIVALRKDSDCEFFGLSKLVNSFAVRTYNHVVLVDSLSEMCFDVAAFEIADSCDVDASIIAVIGCD